MVTNFWDQKIIEIVTFLGNELIRYRTGLTRNSTFKGSNLKTGADIFAHRYLSEKLQYVAELPVLSEEGSLEDFGNRPSEYWIIDPIDGTRSYVEGYPGWVIQLSLVKSHKSVLSVVYAPKLRELYHSVKDEGAYLNGKRLGATPEAFDDKILIDNYPEPRGIAKYIYECMDCEGYIESGSIGLKMCKIASGSATIFIKDVPVRDWDVAPSKLIIEEVGGQVAQLCGDQFELWALSKNRANCDKETLSIVILAFHLAKSYQEEKNVE